MALKAKKEASPCAPKAEAKAKALAAKKAVLKGIHSHRRKEDPRVIHLRKAQDTAAPKSAVRKIDANNARVFVVDVRVNKHQITQAVKKLCDIDVATVSTLIGPDGQKKA
ncbi:60S ribosomal protein L23a-like [Rhinolophus ferrumequinum]|uniref:60S ribosomal protein L23a-like n=1 Tax=Rhinolophus ferrumequinum TaxID=59479 RepID=UPI00140FCA87|nr:60S ribosomal protein L23a-like [Rhinolophus ferrumequinum]